MKFLISFWVLLFVTSVQAQDSSITNYNTKVELLLNKIEARTITDTEKKDLKAIAFDLQNRGQILDESKHDYKGSLELVNKAINMFKYLEDTINIANNLKFKGYLLGRFGRFAEAKNEIKLAIELFHSKDKAWGVAVSNFDLSRVYDFENKFDSAIHYCTLSLDYWKSKKITSRIFNNQNLLINLLTKANQLTQAIALQGESEQLSKDPELHWQDMIDFYFVSGQLYKLRNEAIISNKYQTLYKTKVAELQKDGVIAKSYFDILP